MMTVSAKAKPIDKILGEHPSSSQVRVDCGYEDVIVWPASPGNAQPPVEDKDLLGYGDAEPTPRQQKMPRRSSLSSGKQRLAHRRASIGYSGEMTLTLPNTKQTVTKRRSITFSDDDTVHSGASTYDDSEEEETTTRQLWFRQDEYRHIEGKIRTLLESEKSRSSRPTWLEEEETKRGLEGVLDAALVGEERQSVIQSVLDDQKRQKEMGVYDEATIAALYEFNSMDAQLMAADRGLQDEQDVQAYLEPTKQLHHKFQQRRMSC